ncbi:MAG: hypothetical protein COV52_02975 [Gammaproteobacteria bacterium CG11_big_fil_rev_8_21_14_0_20_46_22]|nr:MAG: hypothetical protein COW05_02085 [Gammaproteobacteria bacterium CG12_big_fil_rev_8_21_14_0_65_46_12]PIR11738.1 MAG: hypothetical protein COV52_02975 [Gammaproteobacteria bacterium CG11_big_fil_rev_8_21_14_0_20_46_22]
MKTSARTRLALTTGLALFAMFFGAGNMIFPLQLGMQAGSHVVTAIIAFVITGVGFPFLGLFAVSLYNGDYWKFFAPLGKPAALLITGFLIFILCLTVGAPRTELVTYHTIIGGGASLGFFGNPFVFAFIYFAIVYVMVLNQRHVVNIIGWFFSPIKIMAFILLVLVGVHFASPFLPSHASVFHVAQTGLMTGYGTMDLLAAVFFATIAYKNIKRKCHAHGLKDKDSITKISLYSCLVGALLIALIYSGLIIVAAMHAKAMAGTPTAALIGKISEVLLGRYGFIFVSICVTFACLATAAALTEAGMDFFMERVFTKQRISRKWLLLIILALMYMAASFGFDKIMGFAIPILSVLYPCLIIYCIFCIIKKARRKKLKATS